MQLLQSNDTIVEKIYAYNNLLKANVQLNGNLQALEDYYVNQMNMFSYDSVKSHRLYNLAIETKTIREQYQQAINNYTNLIATTSNPEKIKYAQINKNRNIRLMLDSLFEGDSPVNVDEIILNAVKVNKVKDLFKKDIEAKNIYNSLSRKVDETIKKYETLKDHEKIKLLNNKVLYDLAMINYNPNIPSIKNKLHYLNSTEPFTYYLNQNYPNPFNPTTNIKFGLRSSGKVNLTIYNVLGEEVAVLINEFKNEGNHEYIFNASSLPSGVYFYKLTANNFTHIKKMVVVK